MPILPAEPDLYPADLWDDLAGSAGAGRRWWCLHTKPRQEKATARDLRAAGAPYYLPMIVHEDRTPQGRKTRAILPLFRGYLFLLGEERERLLALRGNRLVRVLEVPDQERLTHDLRQVHQMLASGLTVRAEPTVPVGGRFRIATGPLAGLEGRVVRRGRRDHFVATVHFLGGGATVDLEDWQVEPIDSN